MIELIPVVPAHCALAPLQVGLQRQLQRVHGYVVALLILKKFVLFRNCIHTPWVSFKQFITNLGDTWALRGSVGTIVLARRRLPPLPLSQRVCEERRFLLLRRHHVRPGERRRGGSRRCQGHGSNGNSLNLLST